MCLCLTWGFVKSAWLFLVIGRLLWGIDWPRGLCALEYSGVAVTNAFSYLVPTGAIKLDMSPVHDTPLACLSTELIPLLPVPEKNIRPIKEVLEFPSSEVYVPHNIYRWVGYRIDENEIRSSIYGLRSAVWPMRACLNVCYEAFWLFHILVCCDNSVIYWYILELHRYLMHFHWVRPFVSLCLHRNLLFLYPQRLNFVNRLTSARNITIKIQFMSGEDPACALPVSAGDYSKHLLWIRLSFNICS